MTENNNNKTIKIKILNPVIGVPITYLDKHNPEQYEIYYLAASHGKKPRGIENEAGCINQKWVYARIFIRQRLQ